jgi:hypothetical protein
MKLHIYRKTNQGLERVNDQPLTTAEASEMIRENPSCTYCRAVDDRGEKYDHYLSLRAAEQSLPPTVRELKIAKNFGLIIKIALASAVVLFIIQTLLP